MPRPTLFNPTTNRHTRIGQMGLVKFEDDFIGDTLASDLWLGDADSGATAPAIVAAAGGAVDLVGGATDDAVSEMAGPIIFKPSLGGVYFETRVKLSAITTIAACVGLFDARAYAATLPITYATTTYTTNPVSGVGIVFDTDGTDTDVWHGIGVKANTDTAAVALAAPVAATYETLGIAIDVDGTAYFYQNDALIGSKANAVTAATLVAPYVGIMARTTASRTLTCDYVRCYQAR